MSLIGQIWLKLLVVIVLGLLYVALLATGMGALGVVARRRRRA